jgi:hypothetical protein
VGWGGWGGLACFYIRVTLQSFKIFEAFTKKIINL